MKSLKKLPARPPNPEALQLWAAQRHGCEALLATLGAQQRRHCGVGPWMVTR